MKRIITRLIAGILTLCIMLTLTVTAGAACILPDSLYLEQNAGGTCTLCASTMMLRSRMYLSSNSDWDKITEQNTRSVAWLSGKGLLWNWTYTIGDSSMTVGRQAVSGFTIEELKAVLDAHPEGIALYVSSVPHAVFLTDYEGDTFYCAEPSPYYSGERIPLAESYTASRIGDQADVLRRVSSYWYIASYSIPEPAPNICTCTEENAGEYICKSPTDLSIRSGHNSAYIIIGSIPTGTTVSVTHIGDDWAHVEYNGISGYVYANYLEPVIKEEETVERTMGDFTGDNVISSSDVDIMINYLIYGLNSNGAADIEAYGDMNNDGKVTNLDLLLTARNTIR